VRSGYLSSTFTLAYSVRVLNIIALEISSFKLLPLFEYKVVCHACYDSYLQVCDHLKDAAKFLGIHVVPIVGGLSMDKQERLLKKKPEIVVGTPGRLWELMSSGNQHLVEVCM
jgi:superfamily II DNA/RNA helicase